MLRDRHPAHRYSSASSAFPMSRSFEIHNEAIKAALNAVAHNRACTPIVLGVGAHIVAPAGNAITLKLAMCKHGTSRDNPKLATYTCTEGSFDCKCMGVHDHRLNASPVLRLLLRDIDSLAGRGAHERAWVTLKARSTAREHPVIPRLLLCDACVEELLLSFHRRSE